jgi:hypothetical protein
VVAHHPDGPLRAQPGEHPVGVRVIAYRVAQEDHPVVFRRGLQHGLHGRPVAVDVGEEQIPHVKRISLVHRGSPTLAQILFDNSLTKRPQSVRGEGCVAA